MFISRNSPTEIEYVGVRRGIDAGHYEMRDFDLMKQLSGVLANPRAVNRELTRSRATNTALEPVLTQLPTGVMLLDDKGHSVFLNRSAEEMLSAQDGLELRLDGSLALSDLNNNAVLSRLISRVVNTAQPMHARCGGVFSIARLSARSPYGMLITALPDAEVEERGFPGLTRPGTIYNPMI